MIEIIPFNRDLFNDFKIDTKIITKYVYINDIDLVTKLLSIDLPIKNKRLALRNIFDFLTYLDSASEELDNTLIPIATTILEKYFSRNKYVEYLKILSDLNILTKVPYPDGKLYHAPLSKINDKWKSDSNKGGLCSQFRIHDEYINKETLAIIVLENDRSKNDFRNEVIDLDKRYINTIKKLEIDIPNAITAEIEYFNKEGLSISTLRKRISRILYTKRKRFIKKGKNVDRIYHSFTNVSRISRKHLNLKMYDVDIKNCQPLLLVAHLTKDNMLFDDNYQLDCEMGNFYEQFVGINGLDRTKTKVQIYKNIFFSFNQRSKFNKRFKEIYPLTWESLLKINQGEKSLAFYLQNLESELFNKLTPAKSKYYFTLFDAIYFDNIDDVAPLTTTINEFFNSLNIKVQVEIGF